MGSTQNLNELRDKRFKAHHMVVNLGYTQKEAASIVGTSEKTVSNWAIRFNWKKEAEKFIAEQNGALPSFEKFLSYLAINEPALRKKLSHVWQNFMKETYKLEVLNLSESKAI